jgi:iron-sulfur cluster assembly protein
MKKMTTNSQITTTNLSPSDFPLLLTERAQSMAYRAIMAENDDAFFLRVSVKGGGCSGLKYNLDIDDKLGRFDVLCSMGDIKVCSDIFSLQYLANTSIDYQETLEGAGFKFNNPNAKTTCGCGSSFSG